MPASTLERLTSGRFQLHLVGTREDLLRAVPAAGMVILTCDGEMDDDAFQLTTEVQRVRPNCPVVVLGGGRPAALPSIMRGARPMVGNGPSMRRTCAEIEKAAGTDLNVLITGETGTGKELVAELIHQKSRRRGRPFVSINCAAIPGGLLESELFGYERGAFTGADAPRDGKLAFARGGTVFLDEIGDMDPYSQAKILRGVESREPLPQPRP